ncbi:cytidine deaminase [Backusella circina FSU 941]|nr:cytidine deaminase [Backusella circina FSU 941]
MSDNNNGIITQDVKNKLFQLAQQAKEKAYCPYSNFRVGAAILTQNGYYFQGCNVENASSGATICAERTAIVKAVSEGHQNIIAMACSTDQTACLYSCGLCRQFLAEFGHGSLPIYLLNSEGDYEESTLGALLPYTFSLDHLQSYQQ